LPAVSCTSGPTCAIADGSDHLSTGDGTDWAIPGPMPPTAPLPANPDDPGAGHTGSRSAAVSCPSPSFCAVVTNTGQAFAFRDAKWVAAQAFGQPVGGDAPVGLYQAGRTGVSCPTPDNCTGVVGTTVLDWDGATWTEEPAPWTTATASGTNSTAIDCPTPSLCAVVRGTGVTMRTSGQAWGPTASIDERGGLDSISCPTTTVCVAADAGGSVMVWNGSSWTAPHQVVPAASDYPGIGTTVSCPNAQFCMVLNADGDYATFTGDSGT
jgi:hypothetical protein